MQNLFNEDRTLTRLHFGKPSGNRGMVLIIRTGDKGKGCKSLTLEGRDFYTIYLQAVDIIIADRGITNKGVILKMKTSNSAFMKKYDLSLKPVTYMQATMRS